MAELKTKEGELTAADLASYGIPPKQPEGPKLVKGQEAETLDRPAAVLKPMPLFSESEMGDFRWQWSHLQTGFVDEPRRRRVVRRDHDDPLARGLARAERGGGDRPVEAGLVMDAHARPPPVSAVPAS